MRNVWMSICCVLTTSSQPTGMSHLIIVLKDCSEPTTILGRTKYIEPVKYLQVCRKVFKLPSAFWIQRPYYRAHFVLLLTHAMDSYLSKWYSHLSECNEFISGIRATIHYSSMCLCFVDTHTNTRAVKFTHTQAGPHWNTGVFLLIFNSGTNLDLNSNSAS